MLRDISVRNTPCCRNHPIAAFCSETLTPESDQLEKAFKTVHLLDQKGIPVSRDIIYSLLQECIKQRHLSSGRRVHSLMVCRGLDSIACFGDHLIRLFASCGSLPEANHVFENVTCPRTHTWNAIISAHVTLGQSERALDLYQKMRQAGAATADKVTLSCILKACSTIGALGQGRVVHGHVIEEVFDCDVIIMNTLVDMYVKCSSIEDAQDVFDGLPNRNVVSWGAIIAGYAQQGHIACALELFEKMQQEGFEPSRAVFLVVLKACSSVRDITQGRQVHDQIIRSGLEAEVSIESTLIDTYAKCGSLEEANAVFKESSDADVVTWGAIIAGYTDNGYGHQALKVYGKMQETGIKPNTAIFSSVLKACSSTGDLGQGMLMHKEIIRTDLELDPAIQTGLVDMYSKCGSLEKAWKVFDDSLDRDNVLWGAIITGYVQHGHNDYAMELFERMLQEGIRPKIETYMSLLKGCGNGDSCFSWLIHDQIIRSGHELDVVLGSAVVDMYAKHGNLEEARRVFDQLHDPNVISWGGMISGYIQQGLDLSALALFNTMLKDGIMPDKATLSCILKACGSVGAIEQGREVHDLVLKNNYESDSIVNSSLLDMYAKCGSLGEAHKVFDDAACRDVVLWGALIASCTRHGNFNLASQYLTDMQRQGLKPVDIIFTSMLTACCYAGLLEEGHRVFESMREDYGIIPDKEHYSCMVDLLSRAGRLNDAQTLLQSIPTEPDVIMWTSLMTGCKTYGNVEMGSQCFENVLEVNPKDASAHVLMTHIYRNAWMQKKSDNIQELRRRARAWKMPGKAWIEVNNMMHEFVVGKKSYPVRDDVSSKFMNLRRLIKEEGFSPQLDLLLDSLCLLRLCLKGVVKLASLEDDQASNKSISLPEIVANG